LKQFINITVLGLFFIIGCTPPSGGASPDARASLTPEELAERNMECEMYVSSISVNFTNKDYQGTINNCNKIINELGCQVDYAEYIYDYFGRSYAHLGKLDSANYAFKQGLKYIKNDGNLYSVAAWNPGNLGSLEEQIYFLEKWFELDESNSKVLEQLSDVYNKHEMYEEQISILNQWLKLEPANKKANGEKKNVYSMLGKDEFIVDKERWEIEPSNINYGLDYLKALENADMNEEVIAVCQSLLVYDKFNTKILKFLGDAYLNEYNSELALEAYKSLVLINPANYKVIMEIAKIYIDKEDYKSALEWAEKAIKISGGNGQTYSQRADVFFSLAESCSEELNHWDRAIYEFAWEDYNEAIKKGFYQKNKRRDFLAENFITTIGVWFQLEPKIEIDLEKCPLECYSWVNRVLEKK